MQKQNIIWGAALIACLSVYGTLQAASNEIQAASSEMAAKIVNVTIPSEWQSVPTHLTNVVLGKQVKFKVGTPYTVKELDFIEGTVWGLQWIFRPNSAKARTRLYVYRIPDALNHWKNLNDEFTKRPPLTAFIFDTNTKQIQGVPIKWNSQFVETINHYSKIDSKWKTGAGAIFAAATADELRVLSAHSLAKNMISQTTPDAFTKFHFKEIPAYGWPNNETVRLLKNFDLKALDKIQSNNQVYIAFGTKPSVLTNVGIEPQKEVLTVSSVDGRRLSRDVPIWPGRTVTE